MGRSAMECCGSCDSGAGASCSARTSQSLGTRRFFHEVAVPCLPMADDGLGIMYERSWMKWTARQNLTSDEQPALVLWWLEVPDPDQSERIEQQSAHDGLRPHGSHGGLRFAAIRELSALSLPAGSAISSHQFSRTLSLSLCQDDLMSQNGYSGSAVRIVSPGSRPRTSALGSAESFAIQRSSVASCHDEPPR